MTLSFYFQGSLDWFVHHLCTFRALTKPWPGFAIILKPNIELLTAQAKCYYCLTLRWRHNGRSSVSNHQPYDYLLNRLFRRRSKKTSKLRVTGLCVGNSTGTGEFPGQMASNAENVSIWWCHHELKSILPNGPWDVSLQFQYLKCRKLSCDHVVILNEVAWSATGNKFEISAIKITRRAQPIASVYTSAAHIYIVINGLISTI